MADYTPFWMVWHEGGNPPTKKHASEESAGHECERLARNNPGEVFHILKSYACCARSDLTWRGQAPDLIPF